MAFLRLTITETLAEQLDVLAGRYGGLVGALQFLVDQRAAYEGSPSDNAASVGAPVVAGSTIETHRKQPGRKDVTVQLWSGDLDRVNKECEKTRMTRSQWITALVRHRLSKVAQFCPADRRTLQRLLIRFQAVEEHLAKVSRTMNRPDVDVERLPMGLNEVRLLQERMTLAANELIDVLQANSSYWEGASANRARPV